MNRDKPYSLYALGDSAITIDWGNEIDRTINDTIVHLYHQLTLAKRFGVIDIVPAYSSLTVYYDVVLIRKKHPHEPAFTIMKRMMQEALFDDVNEVPAPAKKVRIPVCYSDSFAWDKEEAVRLTKLSFDEIVSLHTAPDYHVYMIGFLPGFPYLGEVNDAIAMPRKQAPRQTIAPGSVGIAGKQTGIYPSFSPGGWQIIGRTPLRMFDIKSSRPCLLQAGDAVQFYQISEDEFANY